MEHRLIFLLLPCAEVGHHLVDPARAQTAAEGEDDGAVACAQLGADGVPFPGLLEHFGPDRVAHHLRLFGSAQLLHSGGHGGKDDVHIGGQQFVGHAGEGVLLVDGGLDALFSGAAHHRAGDIAAAADDKVRLDLLHHRLGLRAGKSQIPEGDEVPSDVVEGELPLEAGDLDVVEGIACLCHEAVFHPLLPACKMDLCGGVGFFDGSRDGQSRVDVSGRTAGCDEYTHDDFLLERSEAHIGSEYNGVIRSLFLLLPQGAAVFPLEAGALAAPADVDHHAHLGQQQDEAGAAGREEGQ